MQIDRRPASTVAQWGWAIDDRLHVKGSLAWLALGRDGRVWSGRGRGGGGAGTIDQRAREELQTRLAPRAVVIDYIRAARTSSTVQQEYV